MRSQRHAPLRVLAMSLAIAAVAASGCNRQQPSVDAAATAPVARQAGGSGSNPLVVATEGAPAPYVANSAGTALYAVEGDTDGSKCTGECTRAWPPMLVEDAMPSESPGLEAAMVGVVQRADGSTQVTYNSHPLYRYGADAGAGRTAGHGVSDKWGHWSLISPQGERVPE